MSAAVNPISLTTYPLATGFGIDPDSFVNAVYAEGRQPAYTRTQIEAIALQTARRSREFSFDGRTATGLMFEETNYFRFTGDVDPEQFNFGGLGTTGGGVKGEFFDNIDDGVLAIFAHLSIYFRGTKDKWPTTLQEYWNASHRYWIAVGAGKAGVCSQIGDLGNGNWAEAGDHYPKEIVRRGNMVAADGGNMPRVLKLAIGAGHHNSSGGNATEKALTGPLTKCYVDTARAWGVDVRCYTPNDGLGDYPGNLGAAVREVQGWANNGWVADMLVEVHFQGLSGNSNAGRGVFCIYPDWTNDLDTDVRDVFRPLWIPDFTARTGMPAYGDGGMSEKRTAVGAAGDRLGVFSQSVGLKATTTRTIIEHGCHTCPADRAIINQGDFNQKAVDAFLTAWFNMEHIPIPGSNPPQPPGEYHPSGPGIALTSQWQDHTFYVIGPFYEKFQTLGNQFYSAYGLVASGMVRMHVDGVLRYVQFTERGCMGCYPLGLPHGVPENDPFFIRNLLPHEREVALAEAKEIGAVYPDLV